MKWPYIFLALFATYATFGASLLTATNFPDTFSDLPFSDRIEILTEGYEDWEPDYDENGVCISGCAYQGITIEEELNAMRRNTERVKEQLQRDGLIPYSYAPTENTHSTQPQVQPAQKNRNLFTATPATKHRDAHPAPTTATIHIDRKSDMHPKSTRYKSDKHNPIGRAADW